MKCEVQYMRKDATDAGKAMYNAFMSLKSAITYMTDIILNDEPKEKNMGMEFRGMSDNFTNVCDNIV